MSEINKISIVIPTHERVNLIERLLKSIQKAAIRVNVPVEIIIIDDSKLNSKVQIEQLCHNYNATYISGPHDVREKRNIGIRISKGEIVLFIDSDCEVSENVINEHLKKYVEKDTAGVLGLTEFRGKKNITWRIVERTKFLDSFFFAKNLNKYLDSAPWGTCTNLSIRKEVLDEVNGFDTTLPFKLGGDDVDLGIRINKAGYKIKMNKDAIVYHTRETWSNFLAVLKRVFRWGRIDYYVSYRKHKDKLSPAFPKPITLFYIIFFLTFLRVTIDQEFFFLLFPFAWLIFFLFFNSIFKIIFNKDSFKNILFEFPAQFLHFLFDFGTSLESIKNLSLVPFFSLPLDDPKQIIVLWTEKVREMWSAVLSIILYSGIFWAFK